MKKTTLLNQMIKSDRLEFLMEAHNGLSARIVEEAGFKGIWASSLSISASLGVRDSNEASWTQVLEISEFMSDATSIPILLDGDSGYGNFNNMRRLVKKLEQRSIAGVCIEDKLFPKTNSFLRDDKQPLADIDEFAGKIKAAKDSQEDSDFVVVARVEAFIAGWGLSEALRRAEVYRQAGADAILVHSKKSDFSDIKEFMNEWAMRHPIVIVPTKYYSTPTEEFRKYGISLCIWANHNLRSSIKAMQKTCRKIYADQTLKNVEGHLIPVSEIFRLQRDSELEEAESKYLPASGKRMNAIILAASQGNQFGELTKDLPKTLLKINGRPILGHLIDQLNQVGIKNITVVRGFAKEKITFPNIHTVDNDQHRITKELYSLYLAKDQIKEGTVISYGDIYFQKYILDQLLNDRNDITIIADSELAHCDDHCEYIKTNRPYSSALFNSAASLIEMSPQLSKSEVTGEFIGMFKVSKLGAELTRKALDNLAARDDFSLLRMSDLFNEITRLSKEEQTAFVAVSFVKGSWIDIDNMLSFQKVFEIGDY